MKQKTNHIKTLQKQGSNVDIEFKSYKEWGDSFKTRMGELPTMPEKAYNKIFVSYKRKYGGPSLGHNPPDDLRPYCRLWDTETRHFIHIGEELLNEVIKAIHHPILEESKE